MHMLANYLRDGSDDRPLLDEPELAAEGPVLVRDARVGRVQRQGGQQKPSQQHERQARRRAGAPFHDWAWKIDT